MNNLDSIATGGKEINSTCELNSHIRTMNIVQNYVTVENLSTCLPPM